MSPELKTQFGNLARDLVEQAERIPCSMADFREGLEVMQNLLAKRIEEATVQIEFGRQIEREFG